MKPVDMVSIFFTLSVRPVLASAYVPALHKIRHGDVRTLIKDSIGNIPRRLLR